jgi:TPR repeat protein
MNEKGNSALVLRPPGALWKLEPGAKRILSGMVADTLALAKERPPRTQRPLRIVSVDDEDVRLELMEIAISRYFKGATVQSFRDAEEAWQELSQTDPDLLITDDIMGKLNGDEIVQRLADRKVAYPIIVIQGYPERDQWVLDCVKRGEHVTLLRAPFHLETFLRAIESGLKISRDTARPVEGAVHPAPASSVDTEALLQQGKDFYFGIGVPQSYAEAFARFSKAAAAGHAEAQFHVALCFEDGDGVKLDQVQATEWYQKSAMAGFAKAQNNLAICYRDGHGVRQDYAEAEKWYCLAAEQGYAPSSCRPKNESRGHGLTCEQLRSGQQSGQVQRMGFYYKYKFGHGAPQDGAQAVKWYRMAAERGCADAQTNLGVCYEFGHGVPQDFAEAAKWYRMAAEQDCADAQNKLIVGIQSGRIVPLDCEEEWKWYVRQDTNVSGVLKSVRKGAERGEASEQRLLGLLYERGLLGSRRGVVVPQDATEAYKWLKLATAQDDKEAAKRVTSLLSTMTSDQIQEGERRFREFKPSQ